MKCESLIEAAARLIQLKNTITSDHLEVTGISIANKLIEEATESEFQRVFIHIFDAYFADPINQYLFYHDVDIHDILTKSSSKVRLTENMLDVIDSPNADIFETVVDTTCDIVIDRLVDTFTTLLHINIGTSSESDNMLVQMALDRMVNRFCGELLEDKK